MWLIDYFAECDRCHAVAQMPGDSKWDASKLAREQGWRVHKGELFCPKCAEWKGLPLPIVPQEPAYKQRYVPINDRVLAVLKEHVGELMTHEEILDAVPDVCTRGSLQVCICRLRKEHEIETVRGEGYRFIG